MSRTIYFFFTSVLSYLMANTYSLASEKKSDPSPSNSKSARCSLKDYLQNAENAQIDPAIDAAHAQRAYQLTLEDEGMLPPENKGVYTE